MTRTTLKLRRGMIVKIAALPLAWSMVCAPAISAATPASDYTLRTHPANLGVELDSVWVKRLEPYAAARGVGFAGWASQGMLVAMRVGDWPQLFLLPRAGAKPRQLSHFTDRVDRFHVCPDPARHAALLTRDVGGDEEYRLSLFRWDTGEKNPWPAPPGRVTDVLWSRDGRYFAYSHNPAGRSDYDVRLGAWPDADRLVWHHPGAWTPVDFSADDHKLLLRNDVSAARSTLWELSLMDSTITQILPHAGPQSFGDAFYLRPVGGRTVVAFISDRGGEFQRLYRTVAGQAVPTPLSPALNADVEWALPEPDGRGILYAVDSDGVSRLWRLKPGGAAQPRPIAGLPVGVIWPGAYRPGYASAAVFVVRPSSPGEVYALTGSRARRWAQADFGPDPQPEFPASRDFSYPTFDSVGDKPRRIPARILLPPARWPAPHPVLIQIHGGPELQERPGYDAFVAFCVQELGLAVIRPNVRGSTGYGRSYEGLDNGRGREGAVRDLGALLAAVARDSVLDAHRVAVLGRSYGGFMALSALTHFGTRLAAGVSVSGISDFASFLEGTAGYRRDLRRVEYGDERDPAMRAFLDSISPLTHADRIRAPLLLVHGRDDPRVPVDQSEKMFVALAKNPTESWLFLMSGVGHAARLESRALQVDAIEAQFLAYAMGLKPRPAR